MRNPLKSYWFISVEQYKDQTLYSKHYRTFSAGRLAKPSDVMSDALAHICHELGTDENNLIVTSFSRV